MLSGKKEKHFELSGDFLGYEQDYQEYFVFPILDIGLLKLGIGLG